MDAEAATEARKRADRDAIFNKRIACRPCRSCSTPTFGRLRSVTDVMGALKWTRVDWSTPICQQCQHDWDHSPMVKQRTEEDARNYVWHVAQGDIEEEPYTGPLRPLTQWLPTRPRRWDLTSNGEVFVSRIHACGIWIHYSPGEVS